jgi:hypothetical protein
MEASMRDSSSPFVLSRRDPFGTRRGGYEGAYSIVIVSDFFLPLFEGDMGEASLNSNCRGMGASGGVVEW